MKFRKKFFQSLVEYALIIGLVGIGVIAVVNMLGDSKNETFNTTNEVLAEATEVGEIANYHVRDARNRRTINQHNMDVAAGNKSDIPNSGNNGSSSWTNPDSPSGNSHPIAKFIVIPDSGITYSTEVTFLNVSYDPDGDDIVKAEWQNKQSFYPAGEHVVRLRVADSHGNWSAWYEQTIVVENSKPVVTSLTMTPSNTLIFTETEVSFEAQGQDPDGGPVTFEWENKRETYSIGRHTVTVRAKDSRGALSDPKTITFDVVGAPESCLAIKNLYSVEQNGVYRIQPPGYAQSFEVYCDMITYGGGWTLITTTQHFSTGNINSFKEFNRSARTVAGVQSEALRKVGVDHFSIGTHIAGNRKTTFFEIDTGFTFNEMRGQWKAGDFGFYDSYKRQNRKLHHDDSLPPSSTWYVLSTSGWEGTLQFGTPSKISKRGREWGTNWNETAERIWNFDENGLNDNIIRWSVIDQSNNEWVDFKEIEIWVR